MKNILKITLLTISILTLSQCKDDDDKPEKPNYGAEYFKCKVNGLEFQTPSDFSCDGKYFNYYPEAYGGNEAGYMVMSGTNCPTYTYVTIRIYGLLPTTGHLDFLTPAFADSISPFYNYTAADSTSTIYEQLIDGEMNIEQFIPRADGSSPYGTIKGTFHFTVTDTNALDTFRITDGSFRFDVPQIF
ncbi:hypothetical protein G3O08_19085 [Cryomorpha ignava]|uniref:Uncharacterized protein n=1 Tax=Cryomorpha ignava TaxID=101383 RepID=A0A7K3WX09_9FLAO|nr:hypothetical protein [Cryomorpha ignava]NEN25601.1 hypothetical protein [Cryomorpha ignava]